MRAAVRAKGITLSPHPVIRLTRIGPRPLDDDNLAAALKAVRDGVADGLGFPDDADPALHWVYNQRARGGKYGVRIQIGSPLCTCVGCHCDDDHACAGGCSWSLADKDEIFGLCSACLGKLRKALE